MNPSESQRPIGVRLAGTGLATPSKLLTNDDLAKIVDTNDQWIVQRTGIKQRYICGPDDSVLSMSVQALKIALDDAQLKPQDLDFVFVATITAEMACPSTATRLVDAIGATPAGGADITAACSGFVYSMNMASALIQTGMYKNIAVIGVEALSKIVNYQDRRTCILFGDGAGAAIFSATSDTTKGCIFQSMASDGGGWKDLYVPRTQADIPPHDTVFSGKFDTLQMNGQEVYKFAVSTLQKTIETALQKTQTKPEDLAMIVAHQSNKRILESASKKLKLDPQKLYINIDRFANTSAASIPIALDELRKQNKIKTGDKVLFVGLGGGLTWASSLWQL